MFRVLMHLAAILAGLLLGLFVLNFLADHLSELIGSQLLADTIVLSPLLVVLVVLGWQIYGPSKKAPDQGPYSQNKEFQ